MSDLYAVLGVEPTASQREIRAAYRLKSLATHPDRHDAHAREAAAEEFAKVSAAFAVLSNAVKRHEYDEHRARRVRPRTERMALKTGDETFAAFEFAEKAAKHVKLLAKLTSIEDYFSLPRGSVRVGDDDGLPCSGGESCDLILVPPEIALSAGDRKSAPNVLLCRAHEWLHSCSVDCTNALQTCPLWASFLGRQWWMELAGGWSLERARPDDPKFPGRTFWFNRRSGISRWADETPGGEAKPPELEQNHECTRTECGTVGFQHLQLNIWACRQSARVHICTPSQCGWRYRPSREEDSADEVVPIICWASHRIYPDEERVADLQGLGATDAVTTKLQTATEKRLLTYKNTETGETVEQVVDRPVGSKIGDAVNDDDGLIQEQREALRTAVELKQEYDEEEKRMRRIKRRRGDDEEELPPDIDTSDQAEAPRVRFQETAPVPKQTKQPRVAQQAPQRNRNRLVTQVLSSIKASDASSEDDEQEGYEYNDFYQAYIANAVDRPDFDQDDIGDYRTGMGELGGFEAVLEEEEEEQEQVEAAEVMREALVGEAALEAAARRPIEWHGDRNIGKAHGTNEHGGALRLYDGKVYILAERVACFPVGPPATSKTNSATWKRDSLKKAPKVADKAHDEKGSVKKLEADNKPKPEAATKPATTKASKRKRGDDHADDAKANETAASERPRTRSQTRSRRQAASSKALDAAPKNNAKPASTATRKSPARKSTDKGAAAASSTTPNRKARAGKRKRSAADVGADEGADGKTNSSYQGMDTAPDDATHVKQENDGATATDNKSKRFRQDPNAPPPPQKQQQQEGMPAGGLEKDDFPSPSRITKRHQLLWKSHSAAPPPHQ